MKQPDQAAISGMQEWRGKSLKVHQWVPNDLPRDLPRGCGAQWGNVSVEIKLNSQLDWLFLHGKAAL